MKIPPNPKTTNLGRNRHDCSSRNATGKPSTRMKGTFQGGDQLEKEKAAQV